MAGANGHILKQHRKKLSMVNVSGAISSVKGKLSVSFAPQITPRVKTFSPVEINSADDLAKIVTNRTWSPIIYKNNHRKKENFAYAEWLGLDIDNGETLASAIETLKEWEVWAMVGTTRSHQKDKVTKGGHVSPPCDRYRIIFKMSSACISCELFEYNVKLYLPPFKGDIHCKDGGRLFYPCSEIVFVQEGTPIDWREFPAGYKTEKIRKELSAEQIKRHRENGTIPYWVTRKQAEGVRPGGDGTPGRHSACYSIGVELTELGFTVDEITNYLCAGPLIEIGVADVRRQVEWGAKKGRENIANGSGRENQGADVLQGHANKLL